MSWLNTLNSHELFSLEESTIFIGICLVSRAQAQVSKSLSTTDLHTKTAIPAILQALGLLFLSSSLIYLYLYHTNVPTLGYSEIT